MTAFQLDEIERRREALAGDVWCDGDECGDALRADIDALIAEVKRLRHHVAGHVARIAAQSELLSRRAERC